jgi:hypothetical protein
MAQVIITNEASLDEAGILNDLNAKAGLRTVTKFRGLFRGLASRFIRPLVRLVLLLVRTSASALSHRTS